jgi:two-component system sensor histidine kinase BaeS
MPSTDPASADQLSDLKPVVRSSIARRIALAMGLVALVAVLITGAVGAPLVNNAAKDQARRQLAASANLVATIVEQRDPQGTSADPLGRAAGVMRLRQLLTQQRIQLVFVRPRTSSLLDAADLSALAADRNISGTRTLAGKRSLLEARPTSNGEGIALVEPLTAVASPGHDAVRRLLLALVLGLVAAALAGVALSWRLARPLRRAAAAAGALAAGHREVRVAPQGPAEVAAVADAINELSDALSRSEGRQREFLLSVSHELRTPLTAVHGYAEALADGVVAPEATASTGATILAEAQRLNRLVEDLMELARLRADTFPVDLTDTDLSALLSGAAQIWRDRALPIGVVVRLDTPPSPLIVRTDPVRVRQIIDGLAENALRVLEPGGVLVLELRSEGDAATIEVRDSGPGLTDTDIDIAFERSALHDRYRGERRVGAGVGLALIEGLARRLGGAAAAGHAPEGGAAFRIRLPLPGPNA